MELILFLVAVVVGYFLFVAYKPNDTAPRPLQDEPPRPPKTTQYQYFRQTSLFSVLGISDVSDFEVFKDHFHTSEEVSRAMKAAGLESISLVIGMDFSASNEWQGKKTFGRHCLHKLHAVFKSQIYNPYQRVISILGKTLQPFTQSRPIYAYGFGDSTTRDFSVFSFNPDDMPCLTFKDVLHRYNQVVRKASLSGPTSFAPVINKAIEHVKRNKDYHVLILIADGQMEEEEESIRAIVEASKYPLSIICIGVGDGPWTLMENFDDLLPTRRFDNFQFVNFHAIVDVGGENKASETAFALAALMEIPDQYQAILRLGYFKDLRVSSNNSSGSESEAS